MLVHSSNFENIVKGPVKNVEGRVVFDETSVGAGDFLEFGSDDFLVDIEIEKDGGLFLATGEQGKIKLNKIFEDENLDSRWCEIFVGVRSDFNSGFEEISLGRFYGYEINVDKANWTMEVKIKNNIVLLAEKKYIADSGQALTQGLTVKEFLEDFILNKCDFLNVIYDNRNLPQDKWDLLLDRVINENLFEKISDFSYRDIINQALGAIGAIGNARGNDFVVRAIWYGEYADDLFVEDNLIKYKVKSEEELKNTVVFSREPEEDNIFLSDNGFVNDDGTEKQFKICNNEFLDDDREDIISNYLEQVIFDRNNIYADPDIDRYKQRNFEAKTEGHGYYEVGDYLELQVKDEDGNNTVVVSPVGNIKLKISGGISEEIKFDKVDSVVDYALAGGILEKIYRTEIKVDKQNQYIESFVGEQININNENNANFTQIYQDINNVSITVQKQGGGNLIKNSVGFATYEQGKKIQLWDNVNEAYGESDVVGLVNGCVSGNRIRLVGGNLIKQQVIAPMMNRGELNSYVYSVVVSKDILSSGRIQIIGNNNNLIEEFIFGVGTELEYEPFGIENFNLEEDNLSVVCVCESGEISFTDMYLKRGVEYSIWESANGEITGANVIINENGIEVKSNANAGDRTVLTPAEFAGYSVIDGAETKVFSIDKDQTRVRRLFVNNEINMPPLKIIANTDGDAKGWIWVKS